MATALYFVTWLTKIFKFIEKIDATVQNKENMIRLRIIDIMMMNDIYLCVEIYI